MVVVNPFSDKAKEYLKVDINDIEPSIINLAIARSNIKNNEKYLDLEEKKDILSIFLLMQSLSKTPYSPEVLAALSAYEALMRERIGDAFSEHVLEDMKTLIEIIPVPELALSSLPPRRTINVDSLDIKVPREDIFRLHQLKKGDIAYALRWDEIYDVIDVKEHYITASYALVTKWELIDIYSKLLKKKCLSYIKGISPRMSKVSHPVYDKISDMVRSLLKKPVSIENASSELSETEFPPCVRLALSGVSSGQRNYAITILLTSFLSYARIIPSTKIFDRQSSFTLTQEDVEKLISEVVPLIVDAGDRCEPAFFKEQPLELLNIFYHLGFGMTDKPTVADYGKSKWYLPPSCSKVAENAPLLCRPDEFCSRITWGIIDDEKVNEILAKVSAKEKVALGERILEILKHGQKTTNDLSQELSADPKELASLMKTLSRNKLIGKRKIANPFVYYIRKKRIASQKP